MDSYFFVPATRMHKINHIESLGVDYIVIDLEDAVKHSEIESLIFAICDKPSFKNHYIRVPVKNPFTGQMDLQFIKKLIYCGAQKFMIPKIDSYQEFKSLQEQIKFAENSIILLIENSRILMETDLIINQYSQLLHGIALGSHDYLANTGGIHSLSNLEFSRQLVLNYARMGDIKAIDFASMEMNNLNEFKEEVIDGFQKGYDGKLVIHPNQLNVFDSIEFYNEADLEWAKNIKELSADAINMNEFIPIVYKGSVIERPHLAKSERIISYFLKKKTV
jgi:citrate lyase beta subunit